MSELPEWANWVARDKDGTLVAFENEPYKEEEAGKWEVARMHDVFEELEETDNSFIHVSWYDEEPTPVKIISDENLLNETVNHPDHYQGNKYEAIDIIEDYNLNFHLGNVIKYVLRADKKNDRVEDLKKAAWYLSRELEREEE